MLLSMAFVPPVDVLEALDAVVTAAEGTAEDLERVPLHDMQMSATMFGNVTQGDSAHLITALTNLSARWPAAPTVRFSGGAALEWPGDQNVWAKAIGDVDTLEEVVRMIAPTVHRLGYAVDRRRFRPWLPIGRVTATTDLAFLERLVAGLDAHEGSPWVASRLSLVRTTFASAKTGASPPFEVIREFPLPVG